MSRTVSTSLLALTLTCAATAFAQTDQASSTVTLDPITVTAQMRGQAVTDVPRSAKVAEIGWKPN